MKSPKSEGQGALLKNGISTNRNVTNSAACLKQAGIDFVFRYYSSTTTQPEKRLTKPEAEAILGAGLLLAIVYEDLPTTAEYFSNARGYQDATNAVKTAVSLGQPAGSAIYFAVDYNANSVESSGPILDYFKGVHQGIRDASAGGVSSYSVGVYGSGDVCDFIKGQVGLARYSWLSESTGWNGSSTYAAWDVNQAIPTGDLCGFAVDPQTYDENRALDDFGGFSSLIPFAMPAAPLYNGEALSSAIAQQSAASIIREIVSQLESVNGPAKLSKFFPNGIELIDIAVQVGTTKIDLKVAGPKSSG